MEIDQATLKKLFNYNDNGTLTWIDDTQFQKVKGKVLGSKNIHHGYIETSINKQKHRVHRLIFLWHHGLLPKLIDHIDGNVANNRIENLRACSQQENMRNAKPRSNCSSKYKGVTLMPKQNKWKAQINVGGKLIYLGIFDDEVEAAKKFDEASIFHYKEFSRPNFKTN